MNLTQYDIDWMESIVQQIVREWQLRIKIYKPRAMEFQPVNPFTQEYTGKVEFIEYYNLEAERKDAAHLYIDSLQISDVFSFFLRR